MVSNGERPGKDGTGFSVLSLTIAEKQGIRSTVTMAKMAGLSHEATFNGGIIGHMRAAAYYEIIGNDTMCNGYRGKLVGMHRSVTETAGTADYGIVPYFHTVDMAGIADGNKVSYAASLRNL